MAYTLNPNSVLSVAESIKARMMQDIRDEAEKMRRELKEYSRLNTMSMMAQPLTDYTSQGSSLVYNPNTMSYAITQPCNNTTNTRDVKKKDEEEEKAKKEKVDQIISHFYTRK